jgi:hypothetical protein
MDDQDIARRETVYQARRDQRHHPWGWRWVSNITAESGPLTAFVALMEMQAYSSSMIYPAEKPSKSRVTARAADPGPASSVQNSTPGINLFSVIVLFILDIPDNRKWLHQGYQSYTLLTS